MDVADIIADIKRHGFNDLLDDDIVEAINDAYFDICSRELWPFMEGEILNTIAAGDDAISMPADWSKTITITVYNSDYSVGNVLQEERFDIIQERFRPDTTGRPYYYYFVGNQVYIFPESDAAYNIDHVYYKKPTALIAASTETNILLPARYHKLLTYGALINLYLMRDDIDNLRVVDGLLEKRLIFMRNDLHQRFQNTPDRIYSYDENDAEDIRYTWSD